MNSFTLPLKDPNQPLDIKNVNFHIRDLQTNDAPDEGFDDPLRVAIDYLQSKGIGITQK